MVDLNSLIDIKGDIKKDDKSNIKRDTSVSNTTNLDVNISTNKDTNIDRDSIHEKDDTIKHISNKLNRELDKLNFLNNEDRSIKLISDEKIENKEIKKSHIEIKEVDRLDKINQIKNEIKEKEEPKNIFVYKNGRKTLQQKIVEKRNDKESFKQYKDSLEQFKNSYTDNQKVYFQNKINWYEKRQFQKSGWERLNRQNYEVKKLNYYDIQIWNAAQDNKGILTEKSIKDYANKSYPDEVKKIKFINYAESKLTEFERLGMLNDKSQTPIQKIDKLGIITNKTHTDYETKTIYFTDERINRRLLEIENHIKDKNIIDKIKFNFSSPTTQEIYDEKRRIELTLREEKSSGKEYKELYKGFLTNKDRNINKMSYRDIQAEYEALNQLKKESSRDFKIRKNYRFEVNYNFLNKVNEYENNKEEEKEKNFILRNKDDTRYDTLAIFDKDISDYMKNNKGILDSNIYSKIIEKEGYSHETTQKIGLIKTRILDLKSNDCFKEVSINNLEPGEFKYELTGKYDIDKYYMNIGNATDKEIYKYIENNEKTFNFKEYETYVRNSNNNLSEEELDKKINITQHRVKQLYSNDYFYKVTEDIYISKESFDNVMLLNDNYIRFREGENINAKGIIKDNVEINSFGCQLDKNIFSEAKDNNYVLDLNNYISELDDRQANISKGRVNKLVEFGYLEQMDNDCYKITEQFKVELNRKELEDEHKLKMNNLEKFTFKKVDHNNYFKTIRHYEKKQGYFNEEEYKLEKYGNKHISADDMKFNDKCMIKRFQTMLNAGILEKEEKGNIFISDIGLEKEREYLKNVNNPTNNSANKLTNTKSTYTQDIKFTSFDYTNIAVSLDDKGIFSKDNFINHFTKNNFVGAKGQNYKWTKEQIENKYNSSIKRLESHIKANNLSIVKLDNGSYKLDKHFIDRASIEFEKNKLKGKERTVLLNKDQEILVKDIGSFGQLTEGQVMKYIYNGRDDLYKIDLDDLKRKDLISIEKFNLKHLGEQHLITLTNKGRAVAEMNTGKNRIATKDKLNKEGELAHDIYVYDTVKFIESELAKENKVIEITYSDRQMKSFQQSILARKYDNIGLGMATKYILEEASKGNNISTDKYKNEMNNTFSNNSFINKKVQSFDMSYKSLLDKNFIKKVNNKHILTDKGTSLLNDVNSGRLQIMYSDCQLIVKDIETGERTTLNIEVDLGYTDDEVKSKAMNVPNQLWATNSEKQRDIISKYVDKSIFLLV